MIDASTINIVLHIIIIIIIIVVCVVTVLLCSLPIHFLSWQEIVGPSLF